jgi:hypothetical protein
LRRLILKSAERLQLAFAFEHALDGRRAQSPNQLVLQAASAAKGGRGPGTRSRIAE